MRGLFARLVRSLKPGTDAVDAAAPVIVSKEQSKKPVDKKASGYLNEATSRFRSSQFEPALQTIEQGLAAVGPDARLFRLQAKILRSINDTAGAANAIEQALALQPSDPTLIADFGSLVLSLAKNAIPGTPRSQALCASAEQRMISALESMRQAGPIDGKQNKGLIIVLVHALLNQYKYQAASEWLERLLIQDRRDVEVLRMLGHTHQHWGHFDEAEHYYNEALAIDPDSWQTLQELVEIVEMRGDLDEAVRLHELMVAVSGNPGFNAGKYSFALLGQGKVREGLTRYMCRLEATTLAKLEGVRVWDGSSLSGRSIFVIAEGGTGDEVRVASCYQELSEMAARCTISCDPRLETLYARSFPRARFWPLHRISRISGIEKSLSKLFDDDALAAMKEHDFCILNPELYYHLKPTPQHYVPTEGYLIPNPSLCTLWRKRLDALGPGPKIGVTWRSGSKLYRINQHFTDLLDWGPIFSQPGAHFINLQYDADEQELADAERAFKIKIHRWSDTNLKDDFESVAALSRELDLVLAPNTTSLELAGAVGGRAWYMVNKVQAFDYWRINPETGKDRLYRNVLQFRSDRPADPESLIKRVADEMRKHFAEAPLKGH